MLSRGKRNGASVLAAALILLAAASSQALVVPQTPSQLWEKADLVAVGRVVATESRWDGAQINTYTQIELQQVPKGIANTRIITVRTPGGQVGDMELIVSDVPYFETGENVVLFLGWREGYYQVEGWHQGKFHIWRDRVLEYGLPVGDFIERLAAGDLPPLLVKPPTGFKKCGYDWKKYGTYEGGIYGPGNQGWSVNNNSHDGLSDSQVSGAMNAATGAWDAAGACWAFGPRTGSITHDNITSYAADGVNLVTFGYTGGSVATTYIWTIRNKYIAEVDLVFSDQQWDFGVPACGSTTKFDLQNVATHEFGHWLCLADLYGTGDTDKTMYGYVDYGWCQQQTLAAGDIAGIQAIYGVCSGREQPGRADPVLMMSLTGRHPATGDGLSLSYRLPGESFVSLKVYDVTGRTVRTLVASEQAAGEHAVVWDGRDAGGEMIPSGVYFYRLEAGGLTATEKALILEP